MVTFADNSVANFFFHSPWRPKWSQLGALHSGTLYSGDKYFGPEGVPWIEVPPSFLFVHTICSGCRIFVSCEIFCHVVVSCSSFLGGNEVLSKIIVSSFFLFPPLSANFSQYPPSGELAPRVQKMWHGSFHIVLKRHVFVFHCFRVLKQPMWQDLMEALCKEASMHVSTWQNDALLPNYLEIKKGANSLSKEILFGNALNAKPWKLNVSNIT